MILTKVKQNKIRVNGNVVDRKLWRKANVQALVVCMLASHIEGIAAELGNDKIQELAISVRRFSDDNTAEAFGNVSDMFDQMLNEQNWSKQQLLVALCWIIKIEADKLQLLYFQIDPGSSFQKYYECIELKRTFEGDFLPKNILNEVNDVIIYFKESCKNI